MKTPAIYTAVKTPDQRLGVLVSNWSGFEVAFPDGTMWKYSEPPAPSATRIGYNPVTSRWGKGDPTLQATLRLWMKQQHISMIIGGILLAIERQPRPACRADEEGVWYVLYSGIYTALRTWDEINCAWTIVFGTPLPGNIADVVEAYKADQYDQRHRPLQPRLLP